MLNCVFCKCVCRGLFIILYFSCIFETIRKKGIKLTCIVFTNDWPTCCSLNSGLITRRRINSLIHSTRREIMLSNGSNYNGKKSLENFCIYIFISRHFYIKMYLSFAHFYDKGFSFFFHRNLTDVLLNIFIFFTTHTHWYELVICQALTRSDQIPLQAPVACSNDGLLLS